MLLFLVSIVTCANYAVLYCGSSTIWNYRHQADIYTIYNQLINRGFTASNIVLFAYDDIANEYMNPFKGQVFHLLDHNINVYPGSDACNYRRSSITAQSFYDIISTLPTTSEDYVFIYYINHGGIGFLGTPENGPNILANELARSFAETSKSNRFKKCLFIIEACYSGSVAQMITAPNIAIITAANESEPSNPVFFDEKVGQYLSNEFTNNFIDFIDQNPSATVGDLYLALQSQTLLSHSMYYGDEDIKSLLLSDFIRKPQKIMFARSKSVYRTEKVSSGEATEKALQFQIQQSTTKTKTMARLQLLKNKGLSERFGIILEMLVKHLDPLNFDQIMNDKDSKLTQTYFDVLPVFMKKIGTINPDDYGRFTVIKALAARHSKDYIIEGINNIMN